MGCSGYVLCGDFGCISICGKKNLNNFLTFLSLPIPCSFPTPLMISWSPSNTHFSFFISLPFFPSFLLSFFLCLFLYFCFSSHILYITILLFLHTYLVSSLYCILPLRSQNFIHITILLWMNMPPHFLFIMTKYEIFWNLHTTDKKHFYHYYAPISLDNETVIIASLYILIFISKFILLFPYTLLIYISSYWTLICASI